MRYLLDTNIISDLVRNPQGAVAAKLSTVSEDSICTSLVVAAELRYGCLKKGSAKLTARVESILGAIEVLALTEPVDLVYAKLRMLLEKAGQPIGGNDIFIAAQGLALGCVVVTDNESEFQRVKGLKVENWLR